MSNATWWIAIASIAATLGCGDDSDPHDHSAAHPEGHDHHEAEHGHADGPVVTVTAWSETLEMFAEHPAPVAGESFEILVHLTWLDGFRAAERGTVAVELDGPASVRGESKTPVRAGIYQIALTAPRPGVYRGRLRLSGTDAKTSGVIENIELRVFETESAASQSVSEDSDHGGWIEFLKEQQWRVPFATEFAAQGAVVASVEVAGRVSTPPGGSAEVGAPVTGRIVEPRGGLLHPGTEVEKGDLLASLIPIPSSPEDASRATLVVAEAQARSSAAGIALERARRLIKDQAISQRELEGAEREAQVAEESVRAARSAAALYAGAKGGGGKGSWRVLAPISGTVVAVDATPGATVSAGTTLFRIVDTRQLWIAARVPEQEAARLRVDRNPSYKVAGTGDWNVIDIESGAGSVVNVGKTVDRVSRTVDVIYAVQTPDPSLRVGGLVQLALPSGRDFAGVVVPRTALLDQDGRSVVYVQIDGEHFEERGVRVGPRAGATVGIEAGLSAGERVVTTGAHLVRLAERAGSEPAHGHIH